MGDDHYLYDNPKYRVIVSLLESIVESVNHTAPEALKQKYFLLAEKYSQYFDDDIGDYDG